ncbi:MAG: hypothetical protein WCL53_07890 [Chloroflexota bacterium]
MVSSGASSGPAADEAGPGSLPGPLGLPVGTVRAVLAGGIVAAFLVGHLGGALLLLRGGSPETGLALLGALAVEAGTVTGFYFGVRQAG